MAILKKIIKHVDFLKKLNLINIKQTSIFSNIYHCCTQKTASQWFKDLFMDPIFYRYTGLDVCSFVDWRQYFINETMDNDLPMIDVSTKFYTECVDLHPLPEHTIGGYFYVGYETYKEIPKQNNYRTFFIMRDPRDIVISWYFSTLHSHGLSAHIKKCRSELDRLSLVEGLKFSIDTINGFGLFSGQKSWAENAKKDGNVKIFYYEDFARDNNHFIQKLFNYLMIDIPEMELQRLLERHKYELYSGGREIGDENIHSHYRKGVPGDWAQYFNDDVATHFKSVTGDLLYVLGYKDANV